MDSKKPVFNNTIIEREYTYSDLANLNEKDLVKLYGDAAI
jgi:hypothetical protein